MQNLHPSNNSTWVYRTTRIQSIEYELECDLWLAENASKMNCIVTCRCFGSEAGPVPLVDGVLGAVAS